MVYWLINMIVAMIAWQKATVIRQMYRFILEKQAFYADFCDKKTV